jgi:hypothetical protein
VSVPLLPLCLETLSHSADPDGEAPASPPAGNQMFSTTVTIRGLLKFLNSHLIGGHAIACELGYHLIEPADMPGICAGHCVIAYVYIGERGGGLIKASNISYTNYLS